MNPLFTRLDHIGIAVQSLDAATQFYAAAFGVSAWERISLPERQMAVAVARLPNMLIELLMPTSAEGVVARFLRERGEGLHHVAYEVDDLENALQSLKNEGVRLVNEHGQPGIHDTLVAFVHPKAAQGVLIELVQLPQRVGNHV